MTPRTCCSARLSRGFTLVELVVVLVILGILAAFAVPRFLALNSEAERAVIASFASTLRSARVLAFGDFSTRGELPAGYTAPNDFTLTNLVRCDHGEAEPRTPGAAGGHYASLGSLRGSVFLDPEQMACSGNTIQFVTKSGRTITITGNGDVVWSASTPY